MSYLLSLFQFVFEGMEESGSEGLDECLISLKDTFLKAGLFLFLGALVFHRKSCEMT